MSNIIFGCEPTKQELGYPPVIKHGKLGGWEFPFSMEISVFRFIVQKKIIIIINQYYSSINNYKWFIFFACCFSDQGVEKFQLNSQVWARQDHHLKEGRGICLARSLSVFLNAGATGELLMEHHREMNAGWEMQWTWEMHMNVSWEVKVYSPETQQKTCKSMKSWPWSGFSFSYLSFRFWSANFFRGCALIAEHKMLPARASSSTESSARSLTKWLGLVMPEGREVQITWCILMYDVWICMIHTHIVIQESCIYI